MATLSKRELDIARQIKEQGGSRQDFENVLQQIRQQRPELFEVKEAPIQEVTEESKLTEQIQTEQPWIDPRIAASKARQQLAERDIADIEKERASQEWEEGLKGFISEVWEAFGRRWEKMVEIKERFDEKLRKWRDEMQKLIKEWKKWEAFVQSMKNSLNELWSAFQVWGQVAWWAWDILFEWIENLIQDATPEVVENAIEWAVAWIGDSKTVQAIGESYADFRERKPETARNIEAAVNIGQFIPITKAWKAVSKPFTKAWQAATKKTAEQWVKDISRWLLNIPGKLTPEKELALGKFFAKKVKPTQSFDDVSEQFFKIWDDAINKVNTSLKSSTSLHKPQWAIEVLKVIDDNLKNITFSAPQKKVVKDLIKKFNSEWLSLSELNKIKRSINEYTKSWTAAGKEAAWLNPAAIRWKYGEIKTFIENVAKKEWLPDIKALNQDWIQSNELFELLSKQATSIGKKKGVQALQKTWFIKRLWSKIRQLREDLWFSDLPGAQWLEDIDLSKALQTLKKVNAKAEKIPFTKKISDIAKKKGQGRPPLGDLLKSKKAFIDFQWIVDEFDKIFFWIEKGRVPSSLSTLGKQGTPKQLAAQKAVKQLTDRLSNPSITPTAPLTWKAAQESAKKASIAEIKRWLTRAATVSEKASTIKPSVKAWSPLEKIKKLWTLKWSQEPLINKKAFIKLVRDKKNIAYHWTNADFDKFITSTFEKWVGKNLGWPGVYLTSSPKIAKLYWRAVAWNQWWVARMVKSVVPDNFKLKEFTWSIDDLAEASAKAKSEWFKWIRYSSDVAWWDDLTNMIIFDPADVKVLKNTVIDRFGEKQWLALLWLLATWWAAVAWWEDILDNIAEFMESFRKPQIQQEDTTPRG
jgi:hypothetical protein